MPQNQDTGAPNLTNITRMVREGMKYTAIALVALMVGRFLLNGAVAIWKAANPPPPPPPTVGFGKITPIEFPLQRSDTKPKSYTLEIPKRTFPEFGDRAKVFEVNINQTSLLNDENAKEIAAKYGYVFSPETVGAETYRWSKSSPLFFTMEMNIKTKHFAIDSDFLNRQELLQANELPSATQAVGVLKSKLGTAELLGSDVATASGEVEYLKSVGGILKPAVSESDADFLKVYLNRTPIDSIYKIITPEKDSAAITGIVAGTRQKDPIVAMTYNYNTIDYQSVQTYPIITASQAWEILQSGEGYIQSGLTTEGVIVRSVELGYYDSFEQQPYFQPVFIFRGDNDFAGVVPAVHPQWTNVQ